MIPKDFISIGVTVAMISINTLGSDCILLQEDIKSLCSHVCAKFKAFFKEVTYVSTFKGILQRDEQEQDRKQQNNRILDR